MSPVARSSGHAGRALLVGGVAIVVVMVGLWMAATVLTRKPPTELRLGDQTFKGGNADRLSREIAERGPILYPDPSGRNERDMILQHIGDHPDEGWYAFLAQPPGKPRDCTWTWQADRQLFTAACDETLTAPADGDGLEQFPVEVNDGKLDVDLNYADRTTTTEAPATTTTIPRTGEPRATEPDPAAPPD